MDRKSKDGMPRYQQIALDIATQIVKQQYKVGDRIYARSSLASKYHVSPETARRAICLLADMDIVEAEKGSGVIQTAFGLSSYAADILQGVILFFILGCEFFIRYSFAFRKKGGNAK